LDRGVVRSRRPLMAAVVALVLVAVRPRDALADSLADLEKAHSAYIAHKYDDAETRLRALLDPTTGDLKDPDNIADARMYLGAVLVAEGKKAEADDVFEKLLLDKPDYAPDPLRVSIDATNALIDTRSRLRDTLQKIQAERVQHEQADKARAELARQRAALRVAMLEKLASEERVVERNSRWKALVPFGVGQFQNGQDGLGWVFLSTEGLLAVGSAVAAAVSVFDQSQANDAIGRQDGDTARVYNENARTAAYVDESLAAGVLLVAIAGVVQAELTFVPERVTVRKRALPRLAVSPLIGPTVIGFAGRF
jgi:tetratricopeptide (TPR) repeat protein